MHNYRFTVKCPDIVHLSRSNFQSGCPRGGYAFDKPRLDHSSTSRKISDSSSSNVEKKVTYSCVDENSETQKKRFVPNGTAPKGPDPKPQNSAATQTEGTQGNRSVYRAIPVTHKESQSDDPTNPSSAMGVMPDPHHLGPTATDPIATTTRNPSLPDADPHQTSVKQMIGTIDKEQITTKASKDLLDMLAQLNEEEKKEFFQLMANLQSQNPDEKQQALTKIQEMLKEPTDNNNQPEATEDVQDAKLGDLPIGEGEEGGESYEEITNTSSRSDESGRAEKYSRAWLAVIKLLFTAFNDASGSAPNKKTDYLEALIRLSPNDLQQQLNDHMKPLKTGS